MEFREYWSIARRRGWIILLVALVAAAAALGVSRIMPKTYKATIRLSVNPARADWGLSQATKELLRNYVLNIRSYRMTGTAIDRAKLDMTPDQFLANLDVSDDSSTLSISIAAKSHDAEEAKLMAQTLGDVFVEDRAQWNQEQDKTDRIFVTKVDDVRSAGLASPNTKVNVLAGAVFGAIIGAAIAFFLEWLQSDMLRTTADVEKAVGAAVLGAIPSGSGTRAHGTSRWRLPAWIEPGLLLTFSIGLVIGAGLGALVVSLL